uniref:Plethodontid modulating factor n=1 Tax=Plethodon shermani TaxID=263671 RepID=G3EQ60_9SALA|nr:plethodontid modulating factor precursor [Plethodon shermani]
MRSTVLLIFLAVFVSKGNSLSCYLKNFSEDTIEECSPEKDACMIAKTATVEYKGCINLQHCERFPRLVTDKFEIRRCCHEDLCN